MRMRNLYLYGELAERYGAKHSFISESVGDVVRAMKANFPDFYSHIRDKHYGVLKGNDLHNISEEDIFEHGQEKGMAGIPKEKMQDNLEDSDIYIVPILEGKKSGWVPIVIGIILIIVGVILIATGHPYAGAFCIQMGIGMVFAGVAMLMAPTPQTVDDQEQADEKPSWLFDGPVNMSEQGGPVPLCYGEVYMGSVVVHAGVEVEDV